MHKLSIAALIMTTTFSVGFAQQDSTQQASTQQASTTQEVDKDLSRAHAPSQPDGIGRAVVVVNDESGNPIKGANAKLESLWGGDNFCESWGSTNDKGIIALNPIHMGKLKLKLKAKGYRTQEVEVTPSSLGEPVRVTMHKK